MERKVKDPEGIEWSCVRAYSDLAGSAAPGAAAEATGRTVSEAGTVPVVCTPRRSEGTVRLELPEGGAKVLSDEELLGALQQARGCR